MDLKGTIFNPGHKASFMDSHKEKLNRLCFSSLGSSMNIQKQAGLKLPSSTKASLGSGSTSLLMNKGLLPSKADL